jgi:hypothetical protein
VSDLSTPEARAAAYKALRDEIVPMFARGEDAQAGERFLDVWFNDFMNERGVTQEFIRTRDYMEIVLAGLDRLAIDTYAKTDDERQRARDFTASLRRRQDEFVNRSRQQ